MFGGRVDNLHGAREERWHGPRRRTLQWSRSASTARRATTTVDPIATGSGTIAAIEGMVLSSATYVDSVTVNDGRDSRIVGAYVRSVPGCRRHTPGSCTSTWATGDSVRLVDE